MVHVTWPNAFQGWFVIRAWDLLRPTCLPKFKVSISTHYEDIKDDTKCIKWGDLWKSVGHPRSLEKRHSIERIRVLLAFHSNYVAILHRFWDIARYWPKISAFSPLHFYLAPHWGDPLEFPRDLWRQKTRVPGLSCGVVCVILCLAVLV